MHAIAAGRLAAAKANMEQFIGRGRAGLDIMALIPANDISGSAPALLAPADTRNETNKQTIPRPNGDASAIDFGAQPAGSLLSFCSLCSFGSFSTRTRAGTRLAEFE
jgi:hypothetical protein